MEELFSNDELTRVQTAALALGVSPQEFLRRAALSLSEAVLPSTGVVPAPAARRGLTSLDL